MIIQREINTRGVTWCFFLQASCLHCWRLTHEVWGSDVLSVNERASVERHNSEEIRETQKVGGCKLSFKSVIITMTRNTHQMDE